MNLSANLTFRPYTPADEAACLELFESNTPKFFGTDERPDFANFLQRQPCPFYVVVADGEIVACGGYCFESKTNEIVLAWGMVHQSLHKHGLGTFLLEERLKIIHAQQPGARVVIDTSQHSQTFYARFGFKATKFTENYYAPGLHRVDMELSA